MRTIIVTGGAGYIGSHTVVELAAAGYRPVIVDNFSNSSASVLSRIEELVGGPVPSYEIDFADTSALADVFAAEGGDGLIHFAAFKAVGESVADPLKYYANNVAGLISLLSFLRSTSLQNIVFSSSCTVYGEPDSLPVTESTPTKPAASPYGATKQMAEIILRDAVSVSSSLNALALRYFNPVGAHPSARIGELPLGVPANLVPFVTQTAAGWRPALTVHGNDYPTPDGTCIRDYIHVVDLARAHVAALALLERRPVDSYDVFNIGTGRGNSVREVIEGFERVTGVPVPHVVGPRRAGDLVSTYAGVKYATKELGWTASLTLDEALADSWRWQQTLTRP